MPFKLRLTNEDLSGETLYESERWISNGAWLIKKSKASIVKEEKMLIERRHDSLFNSIIDQILCEQNNLLGYAKMMDIDAYGTEEVRLSAYRNSLGGIVLFNKEYLDKIKINDQYLYANHSKPHLGFADSGRRESVKRVIMPRYDDFSSILTETIKSKDYGKKVIIISSINKEYERVARDQVSGARIDYLNEKPKLQRRLNFD